jgi:UDP-perosamine 4-acetyltransferase
LNRDWLVTSKRNGKPTRDISPSRDTSLRRRGLLDLDADDAPGIGTPGRVFDADDGRPHKPSGVAVDDANERRGPDVRDITRDRGTGTYSLTHRRLGCSLLAGAAGHGGGGQGSYETTAKQKARPTSLEGERGQGIRWIGGTIASVARPEAAIPILGMGAGTHAKSVVDAIRAAGEFEPVALIDDDVTRAGNELLGVPVVADGTALQRFRSEGVLHAFVGVGGTKESGPRRQVFARLREADFDLPSIVHRTATVSRWARVGVGAQILAAAVLNADAEIGDGVILNTGAIVEHDCQIGAHAHIAPGARLAGLVTVGSGAHVGIGAVVIEGVRIGTNALVAAGAVVVRDVEDGTRVAGVPAREIVTADSI